MRLILTVAIVTGLVCGCANQKPVATAKAPTIQARQLAIGSARDAVAKAKAVWQADPKNLDKRQDYDDAVAACMSATGKVK